MKISKFFRKYYIDLSITTLAIIFSSYLMFSTFSLQNDSLFISSKAWSDFASHIPLIRSFSLGSNFPIEYPLFPGEVIKYHFIFYMLVGIIEKSGLPIDFALNIPSIIGFTILDLMIYFIAKLIFKNKAVGILSIMFFLFNSSLTYIYYFKNKPLSIKNILDIPNIINFQSFAPYDDGIISAFWNLNIYTNQRHLALAFALSLALIYILIKPIFNKTKINLKHSILLGVLLGLSFYLHLAVLLMTIIVIFFLGVFFSKIRKVSFLALLIAGLIALPQYMYLTSSEGFKMLLNIGYLVADDLTIPNLTQFWIYNLGISILLIPLGFIFSNRNQKKILLSFIPLFILGNLIQFSPEIAANHKFFNYVSIITNIFCAFALVVLWNKNILLKPIVAVFTFLMIFGGIIDFFPIYNDTKIIIADYKSNKVSNWILNNTSPDSIFLNTSYLYNPASLAGRKIFIGWPYFAWSQGYDTENRGNIYKNLLNFTNKEIVCNELKENNIDYVEIKLQNPPDSNIPPISNLYNNFIPSYENVIESYAIYEVRKNCK